MKLTAMQDLKEDLILTKSNIKDALLEIKNEEINKACIEVVNLTLNRIIKRIDDELLEMEKEQIMDAYIESGANLEDIIKEAAEDYYNKKFKIN